MTVKDILKRTAVLLQKDDVYAFLCGENNAEELALEIEKLIACYNLLVAEVNEEYFPLVKTETLSSNCGEFSFTNFSEIPLEILSVSKEGENVKYKIDATKLYANCNSVDVKYNYRPRVEASSVEEESKFSETKISERILALGVCKEYLLICGQYEEALAFDERFKNATASVLIKGKSKQMKAREWF